MISPRNSYPALHDQVALITGAGRGLGAAIARAMARNGARVHIADVRMEEAERVASEIREVGGDANSVYMDVADVHSVDRAVSRVLELAGRIDALINNAGVDRTVSIDEMEPEDFDRILATNLRGPFLTSKRVLSAMRSAGQGQIINVVSTAAKRAWPNASAYHASKWGLLGFSHALHTEARPHNIKVSALIAGGMRTPFLLERFPDIDVATLQDPADVAESVCYLLAAPQGTVIPEIMTLPMRETSWP